MSDQTSNGDEYVKFTVKELLGQLHTKVDKGFDRIDENLGHMTTRIDSLEADRDRGYFPRKWGGIVGAALISILLGGLGGALWGG